MWYDAIVVGAGLAGSVSARILAEKGKRVLIIDKHRYVGGQCQDRKNEVGITVHMHGPHIFHTIHKDVWDWTNRFTSFQYYQHRVLSYVEGRLVPFPINCDTINQLFGMNLSGNDLDDFFKTETESSHYNIPPRNFRDTVVSQTGERIYSLFYENYTAKQWGRDPEQISAAVAKRIPVRRNRDTRYFTDPYQGIPTNGYTALVEKILDCDNIAVLLGMDYFDIKDQLDAQITIYTGELDRYFEHKYGKLEYMSLDFRFMNVDQEYYQPVAVVNYPNDYDWTRITEYKYFLDEKSEKTTICFEYPKMSGDPYYVVTTAENMQRRAEYMAEVKLLEQAGTHLFIGRLAEYKYYNMDEVIKAALTKVSAQ